jgi:hypothetical protein
LVNTHGNIGDTKGGSMNDRIIKFRFWDKDMQRMRHWVDIKDSWGFTVAMQYTGLLDRNGAEIYESDIVRSEHDTMVVAWNDKIGSFGLNKEGWMYFHYFGEAVEPEDVEVIGNIYENPELLTQSNTTE